MFLYRFSRSKNKKNSSSMKTQKRRFTAEKRGMRSFHIWVQHLQHQQESLNTDTCILLPPLPTVLLLQ